MIFSATRRLIECQTGEIPQLHEFGFPKVVLRQLIERIVDGQKFVAVGDRGRDLQLAEIAMLRTTAVSRPPLTASALYQNPPHRFRGSGKKVGSVFKPGVVQPQPSFMHQRGGLKRVTGCLALHFRAGDPAQILINQLQQIGGGMLLARTHRPKRSRHVSCIRSVGSLHRPRCCQPGFIHAITQITDGGSTSGLPG
jgi:hypothetical protein